MQNSCTQTAQDVATSSERIAMSDAPRWEWEGRGWPNRDSSEFVNVPGASGIRWHVQRMGQGPGLLLVHGTGAATHSWRSLMPLLASRFSVVAMDLPGHGFTDVPSGARLSLPRMASDLKALLEVLNFQPAIAVGHSAGAAILMRMTLDGSITPDGIVSINGALLPFRGIAGNVFSPLAKLFATSSLSTRLFAWRAKDRVVVERLLNDTGSKLDADGVDFYQRLVQRRGHIAAALNMMANWDLDSIQDDLACVKTPMLLLTGANDRTISPRDARRLSERLANVEVLELAGLGHLVHEERPDDVANAIFEFAAKADVLLAAVSEPQAIC